MRNVQDLGIFWKHRDCSVFQILETDSKGRRYNLCSLMYISLFLMISDSQLSLIPAVHDRKEEKGEEQTLTLPYADLDSSLSQPWDTQGTVVRRVEDLQFEQFSQENPEHQTKRKEIAEETAMRCTGYRGLTLCS